jgi:hypothetical protein
METFVIRKIWIIFLILFASQAFAAPPDTPKAKANTKAWIMLTTASALSAAFDVRETTITKKFFKQNGWDRYESPEACAPCRPFVMAPTPVFVGSAAASVAGLAWLSHKMQSSHNHFARRTWWVPQSFFIQWNLRGGASQKSAQVWASEKP